MTVALEGKGFIRGTRAENSKWLSVLPQFNQAADLERIWTQTLSVETDDTQIAAQTHVLFEREVVFSIPGFDSISLVIAAAAVDTVIPLSAQVYPDFHIKLSNVPIALRLKSDLFKPVKQVPVNGSEQSPTFELDTSRNYVEIVLEDVNVEVNGDGDIELNSNNPINLPLCMLGESGVVIEAEDITLHLRTDSQPSGKPVGWRGIHVVQAALYLPGDLGSTVGSLELTDAYIGNGGFSGTVSDTWSPALSAKLFGMQFDLTTVSLTFIQNALTESEIRGTVLLPFFDEPIDVEIGIDLDGGFAVRLASDSGLYTLTKPNLISLQLDSLGFEIDDNVFTAKLSGTVTPEFGDLDWPSFQVSELSIDSEGNVRLKGGWLDLREQYTLDFHGFQLEITKLGFGKTEDGGKWIGFSGGLRLVEGLTAGASVEGLRIIWYDDDEDRTRVTFNGIGVEFEVPEVLRFKGAVSYRELENNVHRFDADIKLEIIAIALEVDAKLVIGYAENEGYTFFGIYLGVELPAGIPLYATGLALYGIAGLFTLQLEPDKREDEPWYGVGPGDGWYKRPEIGVTDITSKWVNRRGSLGLGAGITIGTVYDSGFTFSARMIFVIVFPGPILLLEGKGSILKKRADLNEDPLFRALAVIDGRASSFLIALEAQYKFASGGELIDISGGAEAFFDFNDAGLWHLYIGQEEPRENRVRASVFSLFEANAYFMMDAERVAMGVWIGYDKDIDFRVVKLIFEAWIEGNASLNWKPIYFHGDLWAHGKIALEIFRFELGMSLDARVAADVFDPLHILAELDVSINLPWPIPDLDFGFKLEWGPTPETPPLPLPLQEIAIEHFKVTTSWPLPRGSLLLPNYDRGDGFLQESTPEFDETDGPPPNVPIVPLDCRPHVTFGRTVHDDALVGVNPQPVLPNANPPGWEQIGDPSINEGPVQVRYGLKEIALQKWNSGTEQWLDVAQAPSEDEATKLYGSWAPIPQLPEGEVALETDPPVANVKLWLWSKNPFDYTRHTGRAWDEWFTEHFPNYPCIPIPPDQEVCHDFQGLDLQTQLPGSLEIWAHPDEPELLFAWLTAAPPRVTALEQPIAGRTRALSFNRTTSVLIGLPQPAKKVEIIATGDFTITASNDAGEVFEPVPNNQPNRASVVVSGKDITLVLVDAPSANPRLRIVAVCFTVGLDDSEIIRREEMAQHLVDEMARWSQEGEALEPHTDYRLKVVTTLQAEGEGELDDYSEDLEQTEYAYFRTEGPPGLTNLSIPIGYPEPSEFDSGLNNLDRYVRQTVPATVPALGEQPPLPRPVYRAYDVGVEFNEDYVELMYRMARRDLGLYLYDNNNRPVRDAEGRLIVLSNQWGETEELKLTESTEFWIKVVNASTCVTLDTDMIPHAKTLTSAAIGQVLDPDTVCEARLIPLLLHEDFGSYPVGTDIDGPSGTLNQWTVIDMGNQGGSSHWEIRAEGVPPSRHIIQTSNIAGGSSEATNPVKPGTLLLWNNNSALSADHSEQPINWTDYRLSVYLRSADNDAIGLVFRYQDANNYYRYAMDQQRRYRQLTRITNGNHTILAEDNFVYQLNQDYLVTIEAVDSSLRVYQDGALVFDVSDGSLAQGSIGLYCWGNTGARFTDIRVDDFRQIAPVVYRFKFTTSLFANFFHHLHSFRDETWRVELPSGELSSTAISELVAAAVPPTAAPSEGEARAYETLANQVLGQATLQNPPEIQVTRVEQNNLALAFLVQSPEPIDWLRTSLEVLRSERQVSASTVPGIVKLTNATLGTTQPNEEAVSLLLQKATNLTGYRIDYQNFPGALAQLTDEQTETNLLMRDRFAEGSTSGWTFVDEGTVSAPSSWQIFEGTLRQTSNIHSLPNTSNALNKRGSQAITGDLSWSDVIVNLKIQSFDNDEIGFSFRRTNSQNCYRFSMSRQHNNRRLIKIVDGSFTLLWEDNFAYEVGRTYDLAIVAIGSTLRGFIDKVPMFVVKDDDLLTGQIGLYCWANTDARFSKVQVYSIDQLFDNWLLNEPFDFLTPDRWSFIDEGDQQGPSQWQVTEGELQQTSNIFGGGNAASELDKPGTYALTGDPAWTDYRIVVQLRSDDDDEIGLIFCQKDENNYYRFSMNRQLSYRRLIKKVNGVVTTLWEDNVPYIRNRKYILTLDRVSDQCIGYLDGVQLFSVKDRDLVAGRIGLYCWANIGARFSEIQVAAPIWIPHYTFNNEKQMPAGTHLQIHTGSIADVPTQETNVVHRFTTPLGEKAQLQLPKNGVNLQIVEPGTKTIHEKYFVPDKDYTSVDDIKVLRKVDGTGFFILASAESSLGTEFTEGLYQLKLTYRRDNTAIDSNSQILSQAGNSNSESVTLDIPWRVQN